MIKMLRPFYIYITMMTKQCKKKYHRSKKVFSIFVILSKLPTASKIHILSNPINREDCKKHARPYVTLYSNTYHNYIRICILYEITG